MYLGLGLALIAVSFGLFGGSITAFYTDGDTLLFFELWLGSLSIGVILMCLAIRGDRVTYDHMQGPSVVEMEPRDEEESIV